MNIQIYRKNYKGEMRVVGHLSPEGNKCYYCTIRPTDESYEQEIESYKTLYCKHKLNFYIPVDRINEQLKIDNFLLELGSEK